VDAQEAVREDSAIEERTELALDESRHDPFLDKGMCQPGFEVVLDHSVENRRRGATRGVVRRGRRLTGCSHEVIVVPGSGLDHEAKRIEFPPHNDATPRPSISARQRRPFDKSS